MPWAPLPLERLSIGNPDPGRESPVGSRGTTTLISEGTVKMTRYAHPDTIVSTSWVADRAADRCVRLVEVNVDPTLYDRGHIPGAIGWSWKSQLADPVRRDILSPTAFERLMEESGIDVDTTVVLYGDNNNWFATWAFWQMKVYGHRDVRIMDGGRRKWEQEHRPLTTDAAAVRATSYRVSDEDRS